MFSLSPSRNANIKKPLIGLFLENSIRGDKLEFPKIEGSWQYLASGKVVQLILGIVQLWELIHSFMHIASAGVMLFYIRRYSQEILHGSSP